MVKHLEATFYDNNWKEIVTTFTKYILFMYKISFFWELMCL